MLDTPPMKRLLGWVVLTVALVFSSALCALQLGLRRFDRLAREQNRVGATYASRS